MDAEARLRDAIYEKNMDVVMKLVEEEGVSVNYIDADDGWPLLLWAVKVHNVECLKYLLSKGANVHIGDMQGNTALHKAAYLGHIDCIHILLEYGARLQDKNCMNQTPLEVAEIFEQKEIVALLTTMVGS